MEIIYYITDILSYIPILVLIVSVLINFRNIKCFTKKHLALYILISYALINEVLSRIVSQITSNNLIFINLFAIVYLTTLFAYMYYSNMRYKKIKTTIFAILFMYNLYEIFYINYTDLKIFQTYAYIINSIFLLFISIFQLLSKMEDDNYISFNEYMFIAFFAMVTIINLPINIIINYNDILVYILWILNIITVTAFYYFLSNYLWKFGKTQKL